MHGADVEFERGERNGHHNEGNGDRHTLGAGVEEFFTVGEEHTHREAEKKGEYDLKQRLDHNGNEVDGTGADGFGNAEGDCENDETDRVVERNDGKKDIRHGTLRLVLLNDHEGSRGSGSGSNGAENDRRGEREDVGHEEMESDQHSVNDNGGEDRLKNTDNQSLLTDLLELGDTEFVTHRKSDKAERYVA